LVPVVIRNLRTTGSPSLGRQTAVTLVMLAEVTKRVRQLTAALAEQQIQLKRLMWFGADLQVKLHRVKRRIRKAMSSSERPSG
jgi:hypothetical protein